MQLPYYWDLLNLTTLLGTAIMGVDTMLVHQVYHEYVLEEQTMVELRELEQTVRTLPHEAHKELSDFVKYLQHKYRTSQPTDVVELGGLWADVDLDVSDEDVRALRRQVTLQLIGRV